MNEAVHSGEAGSLLTFTAEARYPEGMTLGGLHDPAKALLVSLLQGGRQGPLLLVCADMERAVVLHRNLATFLSQSADTTGSRIPPPQVALFPARELRPQQSIRFSDPLVPERVLVLECLRTYTPPRPLVVVAPLEALCQKVMGREEFGRKVVTLQAGDAVDRDLVASCLADAGYQPSALVEEMGQFAVRGGLIDIFPPLYRDPVRIEFLGDLVESIRTFDPVDQLSLDVQREVHVIPVSDGGATVDFGADAGGLGEVAGGQIGLEPAAPRATLLDYLPEGATVAIDEWDQVALQSERLARQTEDTFGLDSDDPAFWDWLEPALVPPQTLFQSLRRFPWVRLSLLPVEGAEEPAHRELLTRQVPSFRGRWEDFLRHLKGWEGSGQRTVLFAPGQRQAQRLRDLLHEHDVGAALFTHFPSPGEGAGPAEVAARLHRSLPPVAVCVGEVTASVELPWVGLVLISEADLFGVSPHPRPQKARARKKPFLSDFRDLQEGDFLVHVDYGIGQYQGVRTLEVGQKGGEFLDIAYADGGRLYVPLESLHLVQKYAGATDASPPLSRLGSPSWKRAKRRAKDSILMLARDLLRLYAGREIAEGFSFSPSNHWHDEFAARFPYEETPDQLQVINEVLADMGRPRPMDRLVCGDVGYGKTEVALRAAFKAAHDTKQVAVLVPTTLLAQQHFETFRDRFSQFPMQVEMLSRFRPPREQKEIVRKLRTGEVDIVIGTHRLLQSDVAFKDLGLLIVDEEQRFGVRHKERIKELRSNVDVLTLSATPIPRTLHLSLVGVRDLSVIDTPPEDRLAVRTTILKFDPRAIRRAIERELERGGQVFFVHNRIESLGAMRRFLQRTMPEARICVVHGQMEEKLLETRMAEFLEGKHDLLLTTAIIESGLDIPSVNTIIINRADHFGLAQLYQLRGRVGRSKYQAYAHMLIPGGDMISDGAKQRLKAILELTELGSGFQLAARDMEIRGAGNLLGAEQSGHIAAVGFDLYCQLLEEAVRELRGEPPADRAEVQMELGVQGYIPQDYVEDVNQRLVLYKRLSAIDQEEELRRVQAEMEDRYGRIPSPLTCLFQLFEVRTLACRLRIARLKRYQERILLEFQQDTPVPPLFLVELVRRHANRIRFLGESTLQVRFPSARWEDVFPHLRNLLRELESHDTVATSVGI